MCVVRFPVQINNLAKTKSLTIIIKQSPVPDYNLFSINLSGWDIEQMAAVKYLGSIIDCTEGSSKAMDMCIAEASAAAEFLGPSAACGVAVISSFLQSF